MKRWGVVLAAALTGMAALGGAAAQALAGQAPGPSPPSAPMQIRQVKPGLYFIVGGGGNAVLRTTPQGAILVDTKNMGDREYADLTRLISSVTEQSVKYVFDTHYHTDHTGNNDKFISAGAQIIAQENLREIFRKFTPTIAPRKPAMPTIFYATTYRIKLGKASARAYSFGPGHTGADTVIYFPDLKAVAMGDLLVQSTPNYDAGVGGGSILGFDNALAQALKLDFDVAFPGHGAEPMTKAEVEAYKIRFDTLVSRLKAAVKAGTPKDKLIASIQTDDLGWTLTGQFWTPAARVDALYKELAGAR